PRPGGNEPTYPRPLVNHSACSAACTCFLWAGTDPPPDLRFSPTRRASELGSGSFVNTGTLRKGAAGTGTSVIEMALSNSGTVEVLGGTHCRGRGTATTTGPFSASDGSGPEFAPSGSLTLAATSSAGGAGYM